MKFHLTFNQRRAVERLQRIEPTVSKNVHKEEVLFWWQKLLNNSVRMLAVLLLLALFLLIFILLGAFAH